MACEMFKTYDIFCKVVNLGIPSIKELKRNSDLEKYFGKIVTVSTKDTDEYKYKNCNRKSPFYLGFFSLHGTIDRLFKYSNSFSVISNTFPASAGGQG